MFFTANSLFFLLSCLSAVVVYPVHVPPTLTLQQDTTSYVNNKRLRKLKPQTVVIGDTTNQHIPNAAQIKSFLDQTDPSIQVKRVDGKTIRIKRSPSL